MAKRKGDDYLTQRVRVRLDRWHMARAMLVTAVVLLERLYNTHTIYAALGMGTLEYGLLERRVPRSLLASGTDGVGGSVPDARNKHADGDRCAGA